MPLRLPVVPRDINNNTTRTIPMIHNTARPPRLCPYHNMMVLLYHQMHHPPPHYYHCYRHNVIKSLNASNWDCVGPKVPMVALVPASTVQLEDVSPLPMSWLGNYVTFLSLVHTLIPMSNPIVTSPRYNPIHYDDIGAVTPTKTTILLLLRWPHSVGPLVMVPSTTTRRNWTILRTLPWTKITKRYYYYHWYWNIGHG